MGNINLCFTQIRTGCKCTPARVHAVVERVDGPVSCALLNESVQTSPERRATAVKPPHRSSVGLADLTSTRLFWIVVMAALSGTCLVLLTVAVAALMRRICCSRHVDAYRRHRRRHHPRHQQQQQPRGLQQLSVTSRHRRLSGDCAGCCRHASLPLSQLPLADIELLDDLSRPVRCDATEV